MSNKHVFIFGNNALAVLLHYYLQCEGTQVEGFCLNKQYVKAYDLPLECFAIEDILDKYGSNHIAVYVTIAYVNMNKTRELVFKWLDENGIDILNYFHPSVVVADNAEIGRGNIMLENVTIQPFVKIGSGNILWNMTTISHDSKIGDFNYFAPGVTIAGRSKINNRTFWGCNSSSANDISVSDDVLIGGGAFVYKSLNRFETFVPQRGLILEKKSIEVNLV